MVTTSYDIHVADASSTESAASASGNAAAGKTVAGGSMDRVLDSDNALLMKRGDISVMRCTNYLRLNRSKIE